MKELQILAFMETASRYRWTILGVAFAAQMSNAVAVQAVAPLAPMFQTELGLTKVEVGLFNSAVFLGWWGVLLIGGSLADRAGIGRTLALGQLVLGLFMLAMSMAGSFLQALVVMFAAGLGGGLVQPTVTKAILEWFPPRARGTIMGLKQASVPVGGILTAASLPAVALVLGWRSAMALVGIYIVASGVASALLYRDPPHSKPSARLRISLRAGLGKVLRNSRVWSLSGTGILLASYQTGLLAYLALYFNEVVLPPLVPDEGSRLVAAGGFLALCQTGGAFGRVFWGVVSDRLFRGRRSVVLAIIAFLAAVLALMMRDFGPHSSMISMVVVVFLYGFTAAGWNGLYHVAVAESLDSRYAGTGLGLSMTLNQFGTVGGAPLFGLLVDQTGSYQAAWLLSSLMAAVGAGMAVWNARGEKRVG